MGATEDEIVGWHHQLSRHGFDQIPGDSERKPFQAEKPGML